MWSIGVEVEQETSAPSPIYSFFQRFERLFLSFAQFRGSFYSLDFTDFRDTSPLRDGPLEKLWGGGGEWGIFEP